MTRLSKAILWSSEAVISPQLKLDKYCFPWPPEPGLLEIHHCQTPLFYHSLFCCLIQVLLSAVPALPTGWRPLQRKPHSEPEGSASGQCLSVGHPSTLGCELWRTGKNCFSRSCSCSCSFLCLVCPREIGRLNAGYHNHLTRTSSRSTLAQGMQSDISWPSMKLAGCGQWDM